MLEGTVIPGMRVNAVKGETGMKGIPQLGGGPPPGPGKKGGVCI